MSGHSASSQETPHLSGSSALCQDTPFFCPGPTLFVSVLLFLLTYSAFCLSTLIFDAYSALIVRVLCFLSSTPLFCQGTLLFVKYYAFCQSTLLFARVLSEYVYILSLHSIFMKSNSKPLEYAKHLSWKKNIYFFK